jgi:hypothetical protein
MEKYHHHCIRRTHRRNIRRSWSVAVITIPQLQLLRMVLVVVLHQRRPWHHVRTSNHHGLSWDTIWNPKCYQHQIIVIIIIIIVP